MSKPDLKVISEVKEPEVPKKSIKSLQSRNFWNTCPKKLDFLPTEPCDLGKAASEMKTDASPPCEWWVNSKEHHYCFWRYIQDVGLPNGKMDPLLQNEIAGLLGCSSTKIHFILKEGLEKLKKSEYLDILSDYNQSETELDAGIDLNHFLPLEGDSDDDET